VLRFSERLIMDGFEYAYGIAVGDIDGDTHLDITAADADARALYWFQNDGKGNFTRHFIQRDDPQPRLERHAIADINGDGHPDVVIVENLEGDIKWFENSGTPSDGRLWKLHRVTKGAIPGAYDVAVADFDRDGDLDVAASTWRLGNRFVWFENNGTPEDDQPWTMRVIEEDVAETRMICAADFDRDGLVDLLGGARVAGVVVWYRNPGDPRTQPWEKYVIDDNAPWATHGHPEDIDADGDLDVVIASGTAAADDRPGQLVWYQNDGTPSDGKPWNKHVICSAFDQGFEAVAADLDGDGQMEVVATTAFSPGALYWFKHDGAPWGTWTKRVLKHGWVMANQVLIADLDGDGRPDIIAEAERGSNELRWWRNEGS
jgi:hypothetical protein